jgi:hypothetical protein
MDLARLTPTAILEGWSNDDVLVPYQTTNNQTRAYMKNIVSIGIVAFAAMLLSQRVGQAQGTMLYLSSLSQTYTDTKPVGSDSWLAARFVTGNNTGGYTLDSIQLGMADGSGSPSGFAVMLYSRSGNPAAILPGNSLGALSGPASPSSAGVYSYTPAASLTLSPGTHYFVVATAGTAVANGAYNLGLSAYPPATATGGWGAGNVIYRSTDGALTWSQPLPYQGIGQFAIYATAIPEPGALTLAILGGLLLMRHCR